MDYGLPILEDEGLLAGSSRAFSNRVSKLSSIFQYYYPCAFETSIDCIRGTYAWWNCDSAQYLCQLMLDQMGSIFKVNPTHSPYHQLQLCEQIWAQHYPSLLCYRIYGLHRLLFRTRYSLEYIATLIHDLGPEYVFLTLLIEIYSKYDREVGWGKLDLLMEVGLEECQSYIKQLKPFPIDKSNPTPTIRDPMMATLILNQDKRLRFRSHEMPKTVAEVHLFIAFSCAVVGYFPPGPLDMADTSATSHVIEQLETIYRNTRPRESLDWDKLSIREHSLCSDDDAQSSGKINVGMF